MHLAGSFESIGEGRNLEFGIWNSLEGKREKRRVLWAEKRGKREKSRVRLMSKSSASLSLLYHSYACDTTYYRYLYLDKSIKASPP